MRTTRVSFDLKNAMVQKMVVHVYCHGAKMAKRIAFGIIIGYNDNNTAAVPSTVSEYLCTK